MRSELLVAWPGLYHWLHTGDTACSEIEATGTSRHGWFAVLASSHNWTVCLLLSFVNSARPHLGVACRTRSMAAAVRAMKTRPTPMEIVEPSL
jgi:hypothetical protein